MVDAYFVQDAIIFQQQGGGRLDEWTWLARQLILHGADIHRWRMFGESCFTMTIIAQFRFPRRIQVGFQGVLSRMRLWLRLLLYAGVNLNEYGSMEATHVREFFQTDYKYVAIGHDLILSEIKYGPKIEDWSLVLTAVAEIPFYKQKQAPGAWFDERVPDKIAWPPSLGNEVTDGIWEPWSRGLPWGSQITDHGELKESQNVHVVFGDSFIIKATDGDASLSHFESVASGTQDDHGVVSLLLARARSGRSSKKRSASQPAVMSGRARESTMPGRCDSRPWLSDFHLCPSDGLHRSGCHVEYQPARPFPMQSMLRFSLRTCIAARP